MRPVYIAEYDALGWFGPAGTAAAWFDEDMVQAIPPSGPVTFNPAWAAKRNVYLQRSSLA